MTKTQEIIALVQAGTHRIESYPTKRGTAYELKKWRDDLGIWNKVCVPTICAKEASKSLVGRYNVSLGTMHYTAV